MSHAVGSHMPMDISMTLDKVEAINEALKCLIQADEALTRGLISDEQYESIENTANKVLDHFAK